MTLIPSILALKILYSYLGVYNLLFFSASLIKATGKWGNENNHGRYFELLNRRIGMYFAIIEEIKTPIQLTEFLIDIIFVVDFTPDIFMSLFVV